MEELPGGMAQADVLISKYGVQNSISRGGLHLLDGSWRLC
jgi:hypothetical protein